MHLVAQMYVVFKIHRTKVDNAKSQRLEANSGHNGFIRKEVEHDDERLEKKSNMMQLLLEEIKKDNCKINVLIKKFSKGKTKITKTRNGKNYLLQN